MATSRAGRYPSWYRDDVVYVSAGDVYTSSRYGANTQVSPAQLAVMHGLDGAPNLRYEPNLGLFNVTASGLADRNWFRLRASTTHPVEQYWTLVCGDRRIEPQRGIAYVCLESLYLGVRYSAVDVAALHGMPTSHVSCFLARTMEEARNMTNGYRRAWFMTRGNVGGEPNIVDISTGSELLPTVFHRGGVTASTLRPGETPAIAATDQADPGDFTDDEESRYGWDLNRVARMPGASMSSGNTASVDPASGPDQTFITRVSNDGGRYPSTGNNVSLQLGLDEFNADNLRLALGGTRGVQGRMRLEPGAENRRIDITAAEAMERTFYGSPIPSRIADVSVNVNNAGMLSPEQADRFITSIMQSPIGQWRSPIAEVARLDAQARHPGPVTVGEIQDAIARQDPEDVDQLQRAGLYSDGWNQDQSPPNEGSKAHARVVKRGCIGIRASGIFHCSYQWGCDKCPVKLEEGKTTVNAGRLTRFVRRKKT